MDSKMKIYCELKILQAANFIYYESVKKMLMFIIWMEINKFNLKLSLLIPLWYYFLGSAENQNQHSTSYYRKKKSSKEFVERNLLKPKYVCTWLPNFSFNNSILHWKITHQDIFQNKKSIINVVFSSTLTRASITV